ncbi:MAG: hypothetical protein KGZ58_14125 [Ignavibacteriales bacterium]|nr:hypothetical protein [Ignavibacteriales bacterium]
MDNDISAKNKFFSLKSQLSKEIQEKIVRLAENLQHNEKEEYEYIMRRAAGNSMQEPTDITAPPTDFISENRYYERVVSLLDPFFNDEQKRKKFEGDFILPVIIEKENKLPEIWASWIFDRFSKEELKIITDLHWNYGVEREFSPEELKKIAFLNPHPFIEWKQKFTDERKTKLKQLAEDELIEKGLEKERTQQKKESGKTKFVIFSSLFILLVIIGVIFFYYLFIEFPWLDKHPNKIRLQFSVFLFLTGIIWSVVDKKRRSYAFGTLALGSLIGISQLL